MITGQVMMPTFYVDNLDTLILVYAYSMYIPCIYMHVYMYMYLAKYTLITIHNAKFFIIL